MKNLFLVNGRTVYLIRGFGCPLTLKDIKDILVSQNLRPLRAEEWTSEVKREAGGCGTGEFIFLGGREPQVRFGGGKEIHPGSTWSGILPSTGSGVCISFPAVKETATGLVR